MGRGVLHSKTLDANLVLPALTQMQSFSHMTRCYVNVLIK